MTPSVLLVDVVLDCIAGTTGRLFNKISIGAVPVFLVPISCAGLSPN